MEAFFTKKNIEIVAITAYVITMCLIAFEMVK